MIVYVYMYYMLIRLSGSLNHIKGGIIIIIIIKPASIQIHVYLTLPYCGDRSGSEADLGMFSKFGRTGGPTKRGPHKSTIFSFFCNMVTSQKYRNIPDSCCIARVLHKMSMMTTVRIG